MQPDVVLIDSMGSDLTVVNAARVSLHKEKKAFDDADAKLIAYLSAHEHQSPFFHPQLQFRIRMPIAIARQWFKHTVGLTRNEMSRRYVSEPPVFQLPVPLRLKSDHLKQGSSDIPHSGSAVWESLLRAHFDFACILYNGMIEDGICPEQARYVLPTATLTEFVETGSLAAYARIYKLRTSPDAQREIRVYAEAVGRICAERFPVSWAALIKK
jgi:thymidylate synthase (FAD)